MNNIKIWDSHNRQWLVPMAIYFDSNTGKVKQVSCCVPGVVPLNDGWYTLEGKDLEKIAITGAITHNKHLVPIKNITRMDRGIRIITRSKIVKNANNQKKTSYSHNKHLLSDRSLFAPVEEEIEVSACGCYYEDEHGRKLAYQGDDRRWYMDKNSIPKISLSCLGRNMADRIVSGMHKARLPAIKTISELGQFGKKKLLELHGFGRSSLREIEGEFKEEFERLGIVLQD